MSISLYMDEHVPRAITLGLRLRGVNVLRVQEDGRMNTDDSLLLDRATELNRAVYSQDDDFLIEAQRRQKAGIPFAGVIYAHQLRVTIGTCIRDLELIAKTCDPEDMANHVEYLPL